MPGMIECLKSHTTSYRSVTNDRRYMVVITLKVTGDCHPQCR